MRILTCEQRTPEWYRARLGIPTASCFSKFCRPSDGCLRVANKRGDLSQGAETYLNELVAARFMGLGAYPDSADSFWLSHGREAEANAIAALEFGGDVTVEPIGMILNHGAGASPDGMIEGRVPLELKCPKGVTHIGYIRDGVVPAQYAPQVHGHMVVADMDQAVFMSYCPPLPDLVVRVERNEYTENVAEALAQFNERLERVCIELGAPALEDIPWTD